MSDIYLKDKFARIQSNIKILPDHTAVKELFAKYCPVSFQSIHQSKKKHFLLIFPIFNTIS